MDEDFVLDSPTKKKTNFIFYFFKHEPEQNVKCNILENIPWAHLKIWVYKLIFQYLIKFMVEILHFNIQKFGLCFLFRKKNKKQSYNSTEQFKFCDTHKVLFIFD